jgi:unsaturated rhamnogalacturonyl hydrolase
VGKGKRIVLDGYFNNEFKKDVTGRKISWHYKWEEQANGGFSLLGELARYMGAETSELQTFPDASALKGADVYIIVDPDTEKETEKPNYVQPKDIKNIAKWVKKGGVLLLMSNDLPNAEFDHFNQLAGKFGFEFKKETKLPVKGTQWEMGKVVVPVGNRVFSAGYPLYLKEVSTLNLTGSVRAELSHQGDVLMATSKYGKGTVFAVGDPWLYNEYIDGRKLPVEYKNMEAGVELVKWLLRQAK